MKITPSVEISRLLFAAAFFFFGLQHFIFKNFTTGRPPVWPDGVPGQVFIAYGSGFVMVLAALGIIAGKKANVGLIVSGSMVFLWAGVQNLLLLITTLDYSFLLTNANKSLTISFGAFAVAMTYQHDHLSNSLRDRCIKIFALASRYATGFFLFASGVQHFIFSKFVKFLVPEWTLAQTFWVYFSGAALITGGLSILIGIKGKIAAALSGWMIFSWLLILHIPRALSATDGSGNEWIAVVEALAVSCILFVLSEKWSQFANSSDRVSKHFST